MATSLGRLKMRHAIGAVVIGILLTYQNCSQAPESLEDSASSYVDGLPFAYVSKVDTIGYMSCSGMDGNGSPDPRAYFTFRVGAYNNTTGGISLDPSFVAATEYYDTTERGQALANSQLNSNTRLNLSIRSRSNLQSMFVNEEMRVGDEIDSFLPPLDTPDIAGPLAGAATGRMMNYFPGSGSKRLVEASLRFMKYENIAKEARAGLEGSGTPTYLVMGYSGTDDELDTKLRSPVTTGANGEPVAALPSQAYGLGFAFLFGTPNGWSSTERRVFSSGGNGVSEIDLMTGKPVTAPWECSASYQFMVVRPEDVQAGRVAFNPIPDGASSDAQRNSLNAIRRVLRVEDWFVDLTNMSVMPKRTGDFCYGTLQAGQVVNYTKGACVTGANGGTMLCPHFVSVCLRH